MTAVASFLHGGEESERTGIGGPLDKSVIMPTAQEAASKRAPDHHGERPKMSQPEEQTKVTDSSTNSNSQTATPSPSISESSSGNGTTHSAPEETPDSSSTSAATASVSLLLPKMSPDREMQREGTLIVHFHGFGKPDQMAKTASRIVTDMMVKGYGVVSATFNGLEVEPDKNVLK